MARRKLPPCPGERVGTKRSDRRWKDEQGRIWDSQFEYRVYRALSSAGYRVRRCDESDSIVYGTRVKEGYCLDCGSGEVIQGRKYTADLYVMGNVSSNDEECYQLELKGYWKKPSRNLFRSVAQRAKEEGISLRIAFETNNTLSGTTMTPVEYIHRYCKNVVPGVFDKYTEEITWYPYER